MSAAKTINKLFAIHAAFASKKLTLADIYVFIVLIEYMDKDDEAWPSAETIAAVAGMNARTVQRAFEKLARCGFIECIAPGGGRSNPNLWRVKTPEESPLPKRIKQVKADRAAALLVGSTDAENTASVSENTASMSQQTRRACHPIPKESNPKSLNPSAATARPADADAVAQKICIIDRERKSGKISPASARDALADLLTNHDAHSPANAAHMVRIIGEIDDEIAADKARRANDAEEAFHYFRDRHDAFGVGWPKSPGRWRSRILACLDTIGGVDVWIATVRLAMQTPELRDDIGQHKYRADDGLQWFIWRCPEWAKLVDGPA